MSKRNELKNKFIMRFAETVVVLFLLIVVACLIFAKTFDVRQESQAIYRWKTALSAAQYSYKVVWLTQESKMREYLGQNDETTNQKILELMQPTLNLRKNPTEKEKKQLAKYKYRYLNGTGVSENSKYKVKDFAFSAKKRFIVGLRWINPKCEKPDELCGVMIFDMNGRRGPNRFGLDVFGANLYRDRLEPFGADQSYQKNQLNCRHLETGVTCSQFYLTGGQFFK